MTAPAVEFDGFYQAHFRETVAITYGFTGDLTEAQDIAQEAFSRAWQRWSTVSVYDNPVFWVRRVATNLAHSRWRRLRVATAYLARQRSEEVPDLSPDNVDIANALKQLPASQRKAIVLHYLVDMAIDDVAQELDVPVNTVKSWLHRGRAAMSAQLAEEVKKSATQNPPETVRRTAEQKRARRRGAIAGLVVVLFMLAGLGFAQWRTDRVPTPPASPSPSISPSPAPRPAPQPPAFPSGCTPNRLPVPADLAQSQSKVSDGDSTGRYLIGRAVVNNREFTSLIWDQGNLTAALKTPPGARAAELVAINSNGIALGSTQYVSGNRIVNADAWYYRDGQQHLLKGSRIGAWGLNNSNTIVGEMDSKPVLWRHPDASPEHLPMLAGFPSGTAFAINDSGVVLGLLKKQLAPFPAATVGGHLVAWHPDGTVTDLGVAKAAFPVSLREDWLTFGVEHEGLKRWNIRTGAKFDATGAQTAMNGFGWYVRRQADGNTSVPHLNGPGNSLSLSGDLRDGRGRMSAEVTFLADDAKTAGGYAEKYSSSAGTHEMYAVRWSCT